MHSNTHQELLESKQTARAEFLLVVVVLIWASNYPLAKYALTAMDPLLFNGLRYIVAASVLGAVVVLRGGWQRINRADVPELLRASVVAGVLYQVAFIIGLSLTTAGNAAVLLATSPLWTIYLHSRLHKEKIRPAVWAGMVISLVGVALIVTGSGKKLEFGGGELLGDLITLGAAAFWGLSTNLQKPLLLRYSPSQLSFFMIAVGAAGLTLTAAPVALSAPWASLHWTVYLAIIVSGALSIGFANLAWSYGIKSLGPGKASNMSNLVPVAAFIFSYIFLDERLLPIQIAGAAVTMLGIWLARK